METDIYEIIAADAVNEEITAEERMRLEEWIAASPENCTLYEDFQNFYVSGESFRRAGGVVREKSYEGIQRRIYRLKPKRFKIWRVAAAVAAVMFFCVWYLFREKESVLPETVEQQAGIELHLADGRTVNLSEGIENVNLGSDKLSVPCDSRCIDYSKTDTVLRPEEVSYNTLTVPVGAEYTVILGDGTKVYLNSASEFRYPTKFINERVVSLKGEAYFDVRKDSAHPFLVQASGMNIEVVGTSFNLSAYADEESVVATLVTGRINALCNGSRYAVNPGEQIINNKNTGQVLKKEVNTELYSSWKDGYYCFEAVRLEDILQSLSRWYGFSAFFMNPELKDIEFSGRLRRYEQLEELLDKFEMTKDVHFSLKNNTLTISAR